MGELIDQIVENLDNLDSMSEQLERIGRAHAQVLNGQVSSKLWNLVAETFIDCTLEWGDRRCRSETVRKAWALIIAFMVEKIKHGHLDQVALDYAFLNGKV
jgi:hemoglobin-like flavoprotein